jgi:membrane-bound lytic murein transglycosylase B
MKGSSIMHPLLKPLLIALVVVAAVTTPADAKPKRKKPQHTAPPKQTKYLGNPHSKYRGWDYLVAQLRKAGVKESDIVLIYQHPKMPRFSFVPFKLKPRESHSIYTTFHKPFFQELGATFIAEHPEDFARMEQEFGVPREVVTAIMVIETQLGRHTGEQMIAYRLSRLASVLDPNNVRENYRQLHAADSTVTMHAVEARGRYLEDTFLPEIPALIEVAKRSRVGSLNIKGSIAGAFGIPQFLPTAYMKFGVDGDGDGHVSLYNKVDALWSVGNYLSNFGWKEAKTTEERRKVIWNYNKSDAYIDAVLLMAEGIRARREHE